MKNKYVRVPNGFAMVSETFVKAWEAAPKDRRVELFDETSPEVEASKFRLDEQSALANNRANLRASAFAKIAKVAKLTAKELEALT